MENKSAIDILKTAIIMEKRGQAMYEEVVAKTNSEDVKKIFRTMADEENMHARFLGEQLKSLMENNSFVKQDLKGAGTDESVIDEILTEKIKTQINAAGFEAAAISAAIDMETKSIEVYKNRASISDNQNEKDLFNWLADWERGHYEVLNKLDQELKESIWNDNNFWPF
ncbi:MAG: ferritin family protein [Bacteroidales bacterium]|nr:ferritin family protein [Bacteroidales bacterium]